MFTSTPSASAQKGAAFTADRSLNSIERLAASPPAEHPVHRYFAAHPLSVQVPIEERIGHAINTPACDKAAREFFALSARAGDGDLSVLSELEDAATLVMILAAEAAWADGFRCGLAPAHLVFEAPPAEGAHNAGD